MNDDQTMQWGIIGCARIAATAMIPGIKGSANGDVRANTRAIDAVVQRTRTRLPVELS